MDQRPSPSPPWERKQRRPAGSGLERAFRIGYVAKGILYLSLGGLFGQAAVGSALRSPALEGVVATPLGAAFLLLVTFSAAAYAAWQLICATVDRVPRTTIADLWVRRIAYALSGGFHVALSLYAAKLLATQAGAPRGVGWMSKVLAWGPAGELAVGAAGVALAVFAAREIVRANVHHDSDRLDLRDMNQRLRPLVRGVGTFGRTLRGVLLALVAMSFVFAASHEGPGHLEPSGAVVEIMTWPVGWIVLGVAALGLLAYGVFELVESGHRVVKW